MKAKHTEIKRLLNTAKGQIEGILKMIDDDRYCMDIATQLQASQSLLKSAKSKVMKDHISGCVLDAVNSDDEAEKRIKIEEVEVFINKLIKAE